jgi:Kdo2-lipid IVA lauroyltransferase/acyltransferase
VASVNIELCFPHLSLAERQELFNKNLLATVMGVFELFRAWYAPAKIIADIADIHGIERLQTELAKGKGVLLLTGHFTHFELAVRVVHEAMQQKIKAVVRRYNNACIENELEQARYHISGGTIEKKDTRGLLKALRAGDAVVFLADQNFNIQHCFVPFFNVPAATLTTTSKIIEHSGASMLPFWFYRDAAGRYQITIDQPWENWPSGDAVADAKMYMQKLEEKVREHPEQYLWVHRRFKTRPQGLPDVYV